MSTESASDQPKEDRVIVEEYHIPDSSGNVSSVKEKARATGGMVREVGVPVCVVGLEVMGSSELAFCHRCRGKVCPRHRVLYGFRTWCAACLLDELKLEKLDYKVLMILKAGVIEIRAIAGLAWATREEVRESIAGMLASGRLVRRGFSIFSELVIPAKTMDAMVALAHIFAVDQDVLDLKAKLESEAEGIADAGKAVQLSNPE